MENTIIFNKSKIVATVGPASNTKEKLTELVKAGVDVFRLNFSHGTHEVHEKVVEHIRAINAELNTSVAILQDLQGPKIRVDHVENDAVEINSGDKLVITTDDVLGTSHKVSTSYKSMASDVSIGDSILIDDGNLELRVERVEGKDVHTIVVFGGKLKSRKGINLPNTAISEPSLTDKDEKDLVFGLAKDVDWIALSFVRSADDIYDLKERIKDAGARARVIAKIEKPEAIENIDAIIEATDGIMVARGDLGVEMPMEEVPVLQKLIVEKCNNAAKPVIIATQMMESMIENPRPTRAEANDVANAVMDGADAVMLSAETAAGKFPIQVIKSMVRIITSVETQAESIYHKYDSLKKDSELFINDSLVRTSARLSQSVQAKAIIGMTQSGYTAFRLSSHRPKADIWVFTPDKKLLQTLNLLWGVRGFYYDEHEDTDQTLNHIEEFLVDKGRLHKGDVYINTASMPVHSVGRTNMLKIGQVE